MELALGGPLFASWATTPTDAVALLENAVVECQARARALAGRVRTHTPTSADPLVLIVVDELASLLAYLPERDLLRRAEQSLRQSEERFAKAFRMAPVPMAVCVQSNWCVIEANGAFPAMIP